LPPAAGQDSAVEEVGLHKQPFGCQMATYSKRDITFPSKLEGDVFFGEPLRGCERLRRPPSDKKSKDIDNPPKSPFEKGDLVANAPGVVLTTVVNVLPKSEYRGKSKN
ncbi:MAG: hypothetical protein II362_02870, partial [Alistipes sp.]|nr:hypothetical protein [Alistipes sp.]